MSGKSIADDGTQRFVVHRTANIGSNDKSQRRLKKRGTPFPQSSSDILDRTKDDDERSRWSDETEIAGEDSPNQQPEEHRNESLGDHRVTGTFVPSRNSSAHANAKDAPAQKRTSLKQDSTSSSKHAAIKRDTPMQHRSVASVDGPVVSASTTADASNRDPPANQPADTPNRNALATSTLRQSLQELHSIVERRRKEKGQKARLPLPAKNDVYDLLRQRDDLQKQLAEAGPSGNRSQQLQLDMRAVNIALAAATADDAPHQLADSGTSVGEWNSWSRDRLRSRQFLQRSSDALTQTLRHLQSPRKRRDPPKRPEHPPKRPEERTRKKNAPLLLATLKLRRQYAAFAKWKSVVAHDVSRLTVAMCPCIYALHTLAQQPIHTAQLCCVARAQGEGERGSYAANCQRDAASSRPQLGRCLPQMVPLRHLGQRSAAAVPDHSDAAGPGTCTRQHENGAYVHLP